MERVTPGIIGCGAISDVYFEVGSCFGTLDIAAYADLDADHAETKADEYGMPRALATEDLPTDPVIDVTVVLTPAGIHGDLVSTALRADKHTYTEKPLAAAKAKDEAILKATDERGLTVGVVLDAVLGTGIQTCRDLVNEGRIGDPVGATAFQSNHGHEHWHPDPDGFYAEGGGPLFNMGLYYLTSLVTLLGPIRSVAGTANTPFAEREMTSEPRRGERIPVSVPTHETAVVTFESGAMGTLLTSFDVWGLELPGFEVYGAEGTLGVTDPDRFGGTPRVHLNGDDGEWREISVERDHPGQQRGLGLVDLAYSLDSGRDHQTSGDLRFRVPETMDGIRGSAEEGAYVEFSTWCEYLPSVPSDFPTDLGPAGDAERIRE